MMDSTLITTLDMMIHRLYCGWASTAVSTGIMQISGDATVKNAEVCVLYLWFTW